MTVTKRPLVSVIVVNWDARRLLEKCLVSLTTQSLPPGEVIVVDNGSSDGSVDLVRGEFPEVNLIALPNNVGFSQANNLGIQHAQGDYIALLNNDAEPDPRWLAELVAGLEANPDSGFCASKMLLFDEPHLADACGDFYTIEGVAGKIGHLEPADRHNNPRQVFGASAGAAIYRRAMLEDIGLFDEDFFMVHEDSDLSFRAQLAGYKCLYVPTAIAYHHLSASIGRDTDDAVYFAQRNMEFVYSKNMPIGLLMKYWPLHLLTDCLLLASHARRGKARPFIKAKIDAIRMMPLMLKKRRNVQAARRVPSQEIESLLIKGWLMDKTRRGIQSQFARLRKKGQRQG